LSFDRKSSAPARSASTAASSFGVPEMTMHGMSSLRSVTICNAASPPKPGMSQSVVIRSHGSSSASASCAALLTRLATTSSPPRFTSRSRIS
jgi:hypothetical protein